MSVSSQLQLFLHPYPGIGMLLISFHTSYHIASVIFFNHLYRRTTMFLRNCQQRADAQRKIFQKTFPVHHMQIINILEQRRYRYRRNTNPGSKPSGHYTVASPVKQRPVNAEYAMYQMLLIQLVNCLYETRIRFHQFILKGMVSVNFCVQNVRPSVQYYFNKRIADRRYALCRQSDYDITLCDLLSRNYIFPVCDTRERH